MGRRRHASWKNSYDRRAKDLREAVDKFDAHQVEWIPEQQGSRWGLRAWVGNGIIALRTRGKGCRVVWSRAGEDMRNPLSYSLNSETARHLVDHVKTLHSDNFCQSEWQRISEDAYQKLKSRETAKPKNATVAIMVAAQNRKGVRLTIKQVQELAKRPEIIRAAALSVAPDVIRTNPANCDWEGLYLASLAKKREAQNA